MRLIQHTVFFVVELVSHTDVRTYVHMHNHREQDANLAPGASIFKQKRFLEKDGNGACRRDTTTVQTAVPREVKTIDRIVIIVFYLQEW